MWKSGGRSGEHVRDDLDLQGMDFLPIQERNMEKTFPEREILLARPERDTRQSFKNNFSGPTNQIIPR